MKYYDHTYKGHKIDPYRICEIYAITHPAQAHALKKFLRAGKSHKTLEQDIDEAIACAVRWKEMIAEDKPEPITYYKATTDTIHPRDGLCETK